MPSVKIPKLEAWFEKYYLIRRKMMNMDSSRSFLFNHEVVNMLLDLADHSSLNGFVRQVVFGGIDFDDVHVLLAALNPCIVLVFKLFQVV
jgi:hypothetical protein